MNAIQVGDNRIKINEHIKTKKLKELMGRAFDEYTVFTFIRDPESRGVSAYFFYKNGNTLKSHHITRNLMAWANVFLTKIFPFSLWSLIKPQKKLVDYFFDDNNNLLIDLVGKTDNLKEDLLSISEIIGIPLQDGDIPVKNRSKHLSVEEYYVNSVHKKLYDKLIEKDLKLYGKYRDSIYTGNITFNHLTYD